MLAEDCTDRMVACSTELRKRPQDQRLRAIEVLNKLMSDQRPALKALGPESATGVVELAGGEKDPRNLMIIFSVLEVIIAEWDITALAEVSWSNCEQPSTG